MLTLRSPSLFSPTLCPSLSVAAAQQQTFPSSLFAQCTMQQKSLEGVCLFLLCFVSCSGAEDSHPVIGVAAPHVRC